VTDVSGEGFVPFFETPKLVDARIAAPPSGGRDCLLATAEDGQRLAFGFEAEGDRPGLQIVDPQLWLEAASEPADSPRVFDPIEEINADDWLQAVVTNPVGNEWLERIKEAHPESFETWFSQRQYETGGEQGSGARYRRAGSDVRGSFRRRIDPGYSSTRASDRDARGASEHNPEVAGSNSCPATGKALETGPFCLQVRGGQRKLLPSFCPDRQGQKGQ
jgi:hypothetical protein